MVDRDGLLVEGMNAITAVPAALRAGPRAWSPHGRSSSPAGSTLLDVVRNAKPTTLIGVSGQPGAFSEPIVRAMARDQPPAGDLSAVESDLARRGDAAPIIERWTDGRAVIGTGSPFPPLMRDGRAVHGRPDQQLLHLSRASASARIAVRARRITDAMFMAAAKALARDVAGAQRHAAATCCRR